jgi:hypothetical protein
MAENSSDEAVLSVVDQIYLSVERPELWPQTIRAVADLLGGPRDFWLSNKPLLSASENMGVRTLEAASAGCHGTFLLSRADLQLLDQLHRPIWRADRPIPSEYFHEHALVAKRIR